MGLFGRKSPDSKAETQEVEHQEAPRKSFWVALLPVMACGAGLFSDGYINNVRVVPSLPQPTLLNS